MQSDSAAIDALSGVFFDAFATHEGGAPQIDTLYGLFHPGAIIVNNVEGAGQVTDVRRFVEPRRALLSSGTLENFREWETSQRTEMLGHVAHRFSRYQKYWTAAGKTYGGAGVKSLQFVRISGSWKISALAWDDFMAIRPLEPRDMERIREIDAAAFAPDDQYDDAMYETMRRSRESIVAVVQDVGAGYAFVQRKVWEADLHIRSLAVHPQQQHHGYGEALIRTVIEASNGCVDLLVAESNAHAAGLYARLGFATAEMCASVPGRRRMFYSGLAQE